MNSGIWQYVNYSEIISTIWTVIMIPIVTFTGTQIMNVVKERKVDKYNETLYKEVKKTVKAVQQSIVNDIKGTDEWTDEKKEEVKYLAKTKVKQAMPTKALKALRDANDDLDSYILSLVDTALYDLKYENKVKK